MEIREVISEFEQASNAARQGLERLPGDELHAKLDVLLKNSLDLFSLSTEWAYVIDWISNRPLKLVDCLNARRKYNALFDLKDGDQPRYARYQLLIDQRWNELRKVAIAYLQSQMNKEAESTGNRLTIALSILMLDPQDTQYQADVTTYLDVYSTSKEADVNARTVDYTAATVSLRKLGQLGIENDVRQYSLEDQIQNCNDLQSEITTVSQALGECREWLSSDLFDYRDKLVGYRNKLSSWIADLNGFSQYCQKVQNAINTSVRTGDFSTAVRLMEVNSSPNLIWSNFTEHPAYLWLKDLKKVKSEFRASVERHVYYYIWSAALYTLDEQYDFNQLSTQDGHASARKHASTERQNNISEYLKSLKSYYSQAPPQNMPVIPERIVSGEIINKLTMASNKHNWFESFQAYAKPFITPPNLNPLQLIQRVLEDLWTNEGESDLPVGLDSENETGLLDDLKLQNPHDGSITPSLQLIVQMINQTLKSYQEYSSWLHPFAFISKNLFVKQNTHEVVNWQAKQDLMNLDKEQGLFKDQIIKIQTYTGGLYCANPKCKDQFNPYDGSVCPSCGQAGKEFPDLVEQRLTLRGALAMLAHPPDAIDVSQAACIKDLDLLRGQLLEEYTGRMEESRTMLGEARLAIQAIQKRKDDLTKTLDDLEKVFWPQRRKKAWREKMALFTNRLRSIFELCVANKEVMVIWDQHGNSFDPPVKTLYPEYRERMNFARERLSELDELLKRCGL